MRSLIPARYYWDESIFAQESERIFSRTWQFACVRSLVGNHNDFVVVEIAGHSLVLQNFEGSLRCFRNVCSHRFSRIRLEPQGNGPLRCPYHAWIYDSNGLPTGIAHRPRFDDLTPECVQSLALPEYPVAVCGGLVFVSLQPDILSLSDSMGPFFPEIESLTANLGSLIDTSEWDVPCNWKILVENTLEAYHVDFVHPKSFAKLKARFEDFRFHSLASSFLGRTDTESIGVRQLKRAFGGNDDLPGYFHFSLFPAFLMSTSYGIVFSVQRIVPVAPNRTTMKSYLFHLERAGGSSIGDVGEKLLHDSASAFNRQVLTEDQRVCESVQLGAMQVPDATGMLSDEERRIIEFQTIYNRFMDRVAESVVRS